MNKKKPKLAQKQKVIHHHFVKRKKATLSEIIRAAAKGRRIKELLQNNKTLAAALEEAQSIASSNNMMLQAFTRDSIQVLLARKKLKDMASTIQKLVGDLDDVLGYLDVNHLTSTSQFCNDALKLRMLAPDLETIEESPRSSVAGKEDELMDDASPAINRIDAQERVELAENSTPIFDTSVTEIYNVANFLSNNPETQSGSLIKKLDDSSPVIQTPPTPQFSPPVYTSKLTDFAFTKPKDLEQKDCIKQATSKGCTNTCHSKIPVRRANLFCEPWAPDSPEALISSVRRETFVVNQLENKGNNDCLPAFDRRGTFTLQELANELQAKKKADLERRGTFVIPHLPPQKLDPKPGNPLQLPQDICIDDKTMLLSEDMELTEIIPSGTAASPSVTYETQHIDSSHLTNKAVDSSKAMPSILNASKPISPIEKLKPTLIRKIVTSKLRSSKLNEKNISKGSEEVFVSESSCLKLTNDISEKSILPNLSKEALKQPSLAVSPTGNIDTELAEHLGGLHKFAGQTLEKSVSSIPSEEILEQQKLSTDHIVPVATDLEVIKSCKTSNRASRKSVLPNPPKELSKPGIITNDVHDINHLKEVQGCKRSKRASRKSVLPNPPKELSKQENLTNDMDDLIEVQGCRRSNRTSRKSVLPNSKEQNVSNDHGISDETDLEAINEHKKSSRASRKSVLPNSNELVNWENLSQNIEMLDTTHIKTTGESEVVSLDKTTKPSSVNGNVDTVNRDPLVSEEHKFSQEASISSPKEISSSKPIRTTLKRTSICPKKSTLPKISESSISSSFSDVLPSDSEPDAVPPEVTRKRIPGRRSIKPNRRGPFIFKNNSKSRKSISKLSNANCADSKGFDFSSSEEDEESTKKPRRSKKPHKKSTKIAKNKNTVAVLERDIGLKYQEQGRRKRSLKRKVSFANTNVTPTNSDYEEAKNSEEEFKILDDIFKTDDDFKKTNVPVRKSILKKSLLPACSTDKDSISPDIPLKHRNKIRILSTSSSNDEGEQSDEKLEGKKNEKSDDIEKLTNGVKRKNQDDVESLVKVADNKSDDEPTKMENEFPDDPLFAATHIDKPNYKKKSGFKAKENSLSKRSNSSHKTSEFFGFESKEFKSKRTFSGISERSSKKRITATDDFLDVDVVFPKENQMSEASESVIKNLNNATKSTHTMLTKPVTNNLDEDDITASVENKRSEVSASNLVNNDILGNIDIAPSSDNKKSEISASALKVLLKTPVSENTNLLNPKSKKSSNTKAKKKIHSASDGLSEVKDDSRKSKSRKVLKENITDISTPPPSKAGKTSSTGSQKENIVIPDLEGGGRSRRNRPTVSFKEPSLNRKMRRE